MTENATPICRCPPDIETGTGPTCERCDKPKKRWVDREPTAAFSSACEAIRNGADYSLHGMTLTVNGIAMALTDEQFDLVYDVMDEVDGDDWTVRLAR
jgi:hypothetical protein